MGERLRNYLTTEKSVSLAARFCSASLAYLGFMAGYRNLINAWQAYPGDYDQILRTVVAGIVIFGFVVVSAAVTVARSTIFTQVASLGWFALVYTATISPWPEHPYATPNLGAAKLISVFGMALMAASIGVSEYTRSKRLRAANAAEFSMPPLAEAQPEEPTTALPTTTGPAL